jgi:hypothetical protein
LALRNQEEQTKEELWFFTKAKMAWESFWGLGFFSLQK